MRTILSIASAALLLAACAPVSAQKTALRTAPVRSPTEAFEQPAPDYRLGPGDVMHVFVWRAPELSGEFSVRPDGRFTMPLIEDMRAAGKTPTALARDLEARLSAFVQEPIVTVSLRNYGLRNRQSIRVLGQAANPQILPYHAGMTTLDVLIAVGGLTQVADGNRAILVRSRGERRQTYRVRLDDLARRGDISADRPVLPGDTIIIPESWL